MKILILSNDGDGLGVAHQLVREGNDVSMFIKNKDINKSGEGIVNIVKSWRPLLDWAEFIICDMVGWGKHATLFKRSGIPTFSCNEMADMIELDRKKGMELMERVGIPIPDTYYFDSPNEAKDISNIWEDEGFMIKPSGNMDTSKTYKAHTPEAYRWFLDSLPEGTPLVVQRVIKGVEVSTEGWYNGRDWIRPFNHTFEEKRFMDGDRGPNTGCMGNVVITSTGDKLTENTIEKLTPFIDKIGYRGPIDVNCIVNEEGIFGLELTPRLGYDAIEALMEGLKERTTDLLFETAMGIKKEMDITPDNMIAVRVSVPNYPHAEPDKEDGGEPIFGLNEENLKHIYLTDVMYDKESGLYRYAAGDGVLLKAAARGRTIQEARNRVYRTVDEIDISDKQYRSDIGARVPGDIQSLTEWGYIKKRFKENRENRENRESKEKEISNA